MLYKGLVAEVIYDTSDLGSVAKIASAFKLDASTLQHAPNNSCLVKLYGSNLSPKEELVIAYPMLPPHVSIPIKPGECVWLLSPSTSEPLPNELYWLCRITADINSDDVNFTHLPRKSTTPVSEEENAGVETSTADKAESLDSGAEPTTAAADDTPTLPAFTNGDDGAFIPQTKKVGDKEKKENPFDLIAESSFSYSALSLEPVPNYMKYPGDLVLQGSNNSLISLGVDRGIAVSANNDEPELLLSGTVKNSITDGSGTVDIVAGRSRYPSSPKTLSSPPPTPERTMLRTTLNQRGFVENLKADPSALEGAPDFATDASRIYVSMKTDGDNNFGLLNELGRMPSGIVTGSITPVAEAAYAITKADEIRLIARKQLENEYFTSVETPEINGSIKIIKEGAPDGDLAAVVLQPDGSIQISGSRIFLGRHPDDGGLDEGGSGPGDATQAQPYVRYQQLEDLLNAVMDNIEAFCDTLNTHVTPGYGNPSPQILQAAATLKADMASRRQEIESLKSERIFGE